MDDKAVEAIKVLVKERIAFRFLNVRDHADLEEVLNKMKSEVLQSLDQGPVSIFIVGGGCPTKH